MNYWVFGNASVRVAVSEDYATIDWETRSACSIKKSGSWRYSLDETTEVLCLAFRLPWWGEPDEWSDARVDLWHPAFPHLGIEEADCTSLYLELFDWIEQGGKVEAHNAWFERGIWQNVMMPTYGWPSIHADQWRCSAAKAASHALPRALDDACAALGLKIRKDPAGHKVMKKMSKPRKPRKAEREAGAQGLLWWETPELLETLFAYCKQDVRAECALSAALPDLTEKESELYALDQTINERGFALDRCGVESALQLIARESIRLNAELSEITQGSVRKATQRAQMLRWFQTQGVYLDNTRAETLDSYLAPECREEIPGPVRRALEIMRALGKSSTAKYQAMADWVCPDDRAHGGLLFHGASTGRWTGTGIQPHNFPKGSVKGHTMEDIWSYLNTL